MNTPWLEARRVPSALKVVSVNTLSVAFFTDAGWAKAIAAATASINVEMNFLYVIIVIILIY